MATTSGMQAETSAVKTTINKDKNSWQTITAAKKRTSSPGLENNEKRHRPEELSNHNRFSELQTDDNEMNIVPNILKPPPIYIPGVTNILQMTEGFKTVIAPNNYQYKSVENGQIRVMAKNAEAHRLIVKYLEVNNIKFHTYQLKQERSFRFVIKGLHHSTPIPSIESELILLKHSVRQVINSKSRVTKEPLSMFFVDLDHKPNNKEVYNINHIENAMVTVEPIKQNTEIIQCHRCQEFGHTQRYCRKQHRCVKCALNHPTAECQKPKETPPQCVHCLLQHTENYKRCVAYQQILKKKHHM